MKNSILFQLLGYFIFIFFNNPQTLNAHVAERDVNDLYDFIVVGSGSAGSVVASRLSEDRNVRVLLLEAGGDENIISEIPIMCSYLQLSELDWNYKVVPQKNACLGLENKQCNWPRGKVLGGTSVINYMAYTRGNRRDFDQWASLGNYGWNYDEILYYFLKSEDNTIPWIADDIKYHRSGGLLTISETEYKTPLLAAFLKGGEKLGYPTRDTNGEFQTGVQPTAATIRRGARCSAAKAFLWSASHRRNLKIIVNAHVVKIIFDENKRATGVVYERFGRSVEVSAKKEIILSAGTIGTPQLLMLSGVGPRSHLESFNIPVVADLPGVGENLQDHISGGGLVFTVDYPVSFIESRLLSNITNMLCWVLSGTGPMASPGGLEAVGFVNTPFANKSDDWPDIELQYASGSAVADGGRQLWRNIGLTEHAWKQYYVPILGRDTFYILPTIMRPKSSGFVRLRSTDPYEHPIIDPKYFSHPDDLRIVTEGMKLAMAFATSEPMKKFGAKFIPTKFPGCEKFESPSDEYLSCLAQYYTTTMDHMSGTAKMGVATDPMAVVDPELRVYAVKGLRVADGSIMPKIVSANTNAAIIMIGEKASDLIKKEWKLTKNQS